jgi:hypothetical protein
MGVTQKSLDGLPWNIIRAPRAPRLCLPRKAHNGIGREPCIRHRAADVVHDAPGGSKFKGLKKLRCSWKKYGTNGI